MNKRYLAFAMGIALDAAAAFGTQTVVDGVLTISDETKTVVSEADFGAGVTNVVLDSATVSFDLTNSPTLTRTYQVTERGGKLGVGPSEQAATIASTKFLKPNLGRTFGKTGAGTLKIGTALGAVATPTKFIVHEGMVRLTTGDFFGVHSVCTTNFVIDVREGATWHNGTSHGAVGPVELTGATWISDNPSPYSGTWADTSFKGGITVHPSSTPSKMYATSWFFLTQPLASNPDADKCVIDVETGAELYVYGDLHNGSGQTSVLVKRGGGALYLLGKGSWTGGTTLEGGKIVLGNANALGTSAITIAGDVEIAVDPGVTVTCPELKGSGHVTVSGKGGITFPKKAEAVTGATDKAADPYSPLSGITLTVRPGVTDVSITGTTPLTVSKVVELHPGCASLADIRKTGAGTLKLGNGLSGKYRKLIVTGGVVEFTDNGCFGMSGIGNKGGVEISGGKIRPTSKYSCGQTRFTFTGANGGLDVPAGIVFEATSNCFYCAGATVTKTGVGGWKLTSNFLTSLARVAGTKWVVDEGRLFTDGGSTFGSHSVAWDGTIEVHENGEFAMDGANGHQPVGKLVLRGGTVRAPISQFQSESFNPEGGGQWTGFSFNGGITALASEKPSRVIARACHVSHEKNQCVFDVEEGATLVMDTMLRRGYTYSPSFAWQDGNLVKTGVGTLKLLKPLSIKGLFDIRAGTVELAEGGYIDPSARVCMSKDAKLILNDGTRFVSNAEVERGILNEAEVWIDATRVSAADGATLSTIANLGTAGGSFAKFSKAISNSGGMIPNAPKFVANGIGGKPSFSFDGQMALALDSYTNTTDNCEIFVVAMWTSYEASDGKGRWGGVVSLGSVKMTANEDQHNFGVLSTMVDSGSAGKFGSMSVIFGTPEGNETSGANHATASLNTTLLSPGVSTNEAFVLRIQRGSTSGNSEMWFGDARGAKSNSSTYTERKCRIDRVCLGSRLMTGGLATTYNTLSKSRNIIGQVGEFLVFSKKLSPDERAAVNDYLRRKWIGTSATMRPEWKEAMTAELAVETPTASEADFVATAAVGGTGDFRLAKTGAGVLRIGGSVSTAPTFTVEEGGIRFKDGKLASRAAIWVDADDEASCLCDGDGNVTNLLNKGSCGGSFVRATPTGSVPMHYPKLTPNSFNGRSTLTFDGEAALITSCYTNHTSPRKMSVYAVWRRNRWELHPGAENGGGYGKWATVYTFVPVAAKSDDEAIPGVFHVDESSSTSSYLELGNYNTDGFSVPTNGEVAIFTAHVTTNGWSVAHEKKATDITKVPRVSNAGTVRNIEAADIDRVILGGRAASGARVHYKGKGNTSNRCWYGDLAEFIVTTEPLSPEEEADLYAYLRKKWFNKGDGSTTPPAWLSGIPAAPTFGAQTVLSMADGTSLRHEAACVTLGAIETTGVVDWTRVWSGADDAELKMFDIAEGAVFGGAMTLTVNAVPKNPASLVQGVGELPAVPITTIVAPKGKPYVTKRTVEGADAYWFVSSAGTVIYLR